jgi:hypothetical protein
MAKPVTGTFTRPVPDGIGEWDQSHLIELAEHLPIKHVLLSSIRELDSYMWCGGPRKVTATVREIASHAPRIMSADLSYPIILSADGSLMDGAHRIARAFAEGRSHIAARQFSVDPKPDRIR